MFGQYAMLFPRGGNMQLITKERFIFAVITILLLGVIAYGAIWFNSKYVLLPVEREKVEIMDNCSNNIVACDLIYSSVDEIPD